MTVDFRYPTGTQVDCKIGGALVRGFTVLAATIDQFDRHHYRLGWADRGELFTLEAPEHLLASSTQGESQS